MKREEAIEMLQGAIKKPNTKDGYLWQAIDMAIKALEQEPCDDAVSRQAVLEQINCWIGSGEYRYTNATHYLTRRMQELPPVTPQEPKWIPISERLPKPKETENLIAKYYLVQNEYGDMLVARWDGKGWEQMYQHEYLEDDVIAWRPLPEPMKAESEE